MPPLQSPLHQMQCADITPDDVQATVEANPEIGAKIEAIMMVALCARDRDGRKVLLRIPPAVAMGILRVLASPTPLLAAADLCEQDRQRANVISPDFSR